MKRFTVFFATALSVVILAGCGGSSEQQDVPSTDSAAGATVEVAKPLSLEFSKAFDVAMNDQLVEIEGYMQLPSMMYTSGKSAQVDFTARPYQRYGSHITANIATGSCNNCMKPLGEKYDINDLHVKDKDGTEVGPNQRVRITGRLNVYPSGLSENGHTASLSPTKIEKIDEVELDYSTMNVVTITKENLQDTSLKYALSYVESKVEVPSILFMENDVTLNAKVAGQRLPVNFLFGKGPNQIEPIPSNYSKDDFKIHDYKGELVNLNKTLKLWGNRSTPDDKNPGIFYVERIAQ